MDDVTRLFGLSFCMLLGCYVAGAIPLAFTMSEVTMQVKAFWRYEMLSFLLISLKALTDQVHVDILFDDILLDDTSLRAIIAKNLPPNFCFKADVSVMLITNE